MAKLKKPRLTAAEALERVYEILCACADNLEPCPSNGYMAEMTGTGSGRISDRVLTLLLTGRISIEHKTRTIRRITITATGSTTDWGIPAYRQGDEERRLMEDGGINWPDYSPHNLVFNSSIVG